MSEKTESELKQVTEGRDESTPFKALLGVGVVVAGAFIVVGLIVWLVVR